MFDMSSEKMCLLLLGSNSLKVCVLFDVNSEKVFELVKILSFFDH